MTDLTKPERVATVAAFARHGDTRRLRPRIDREANGLELPARSVPEPDRERTKPDHDRAARADQSSGAPLRARHQRLFSFVDDEYRHLLS
jgi:hypothetical protein